jgi:hypothetical protein
MLLSLPLVCSKHFISILPSNIMTEMVAISKFQSLWCFESEDRQIQCDVVEIIKHKHLCVIHYYKQTELLGN